MNQVGLEVMAKDFRHFVFLILKMKQDNLSLKGNAKIKVKKDKLVADDG